MKTEHKIIIGLVAAYGAFVYARHKGIFGVSGTSGIGDLTAWNKRHLDNFFERNMWGDRVVVYITYEDDRGYIPVDFKYAGHNYAGASCVVSPNNLDYLKELCRTYNCSYLEVSDWPGFFPNLQHKA